MGNTPSRSVRATTLLGSLALVGLGCDLVLLVHPAPTELLGLLGAKYPVAGAGACAAFGIRRLLVRAREACLADLHD